MPEMDEAVLKRVLPHSIEAEQSVIGSMLMDKEAITIASEQISGEDFYGKQYGILFDAMVELNDEAKLSPPPSEKHRLQMNCRGYWI